MPRDGLRAWWNAEYADCEAFVCVDVRGYKGGAIFDVTFRAHRVIWAMVHGKWPEDEIDHINHDKADNRIENLRDVTRQENCRNRSMNSNNTSGTTGVHWSNASKIWVARIKIGGGALVHIGSFKNKQDAIDARKAAEIKYGFHLNHGK